MDDQLISEDDLDALLSARNPVAPAGLSTPSITRALFELREATFPRAEAPTLLRPVRGRLVRGRPVRLRSRRLIAVGCAVAMIVIAGSLIGLNVGGSGNSSGGLMTVTPAQAAELNRIAAATVQQRGPGKDQWLYQRYLESEGGAESFDDQNVNFRDTRSVQQWTNADNVDRTRSLYTSFTFDTPQDRANYYGRYHSQLAGSLIDGPASPDHIADDADPSAGPNPDAPQNLPDTSQGILSHFKKNFAKETAGVPKKYRAQFAAQYAAFFFSDIVDILQQSTSEHQRAAALKDIAYVPHVRVLGDRTDARGRAGLAIRYVDTAGLGHVNTIIVDRQTGDLLQETLSNLESGDGFTVADSFTRSVYLQRTIVKSMTALPGGGSVRYNGPPPILARGTSTK
jgi:hypothetical protein